MNAETARSVFSTFTPEEKEKAKKLKASGLPPLQAIKQIHAEKIGDVAREAQPDLDAAESDPSFIENAAAGAQQAGKVMGFGLDDEVLGGLTALGRAPQRLLSLEPGKIADDYREGRDRQRDENEAIERFAPEAAGTGKLGGAAISAASGGLVAGNAAKNAPTILKAVLDGAKTGAGTGAVAGFGEDEGSVVGNTVKGAGIGAALGGGFSGAMAVANPVLRRAGTEAVKGLLQRKPDIKGVAGDVAVDAVKKLPSGSALIKRMRDPNAGRAASFADELAAEPAAFLNDVPPRVAPPPTPKPTSAPPPEVTNPALESPVPPIDDAAELAGVLKPRDPAKQALLDQKLAEAKAVVDAANAGQPIPEPTPVTPEQRNMALASKTTPSRGALLPKGEKPASQVLRPKPVEVDAAPKGSTRVLRPRKDPRASDAFDEAGLKAFDENGVEQPNPNIARARKQASDSLDKGSSKGSLQRMQEQTVSPPPAKPTINDAQIDEVVAHLRAHPDQQAGSLPMLRMAFGEDVVNQIAAKLAQ